MSALASDQLSDDDALLSTAQPPVERPLSEHHCPWCHCRHGFGYCGHASWLTQVALARRGAHFNWR